MAIVFSSSPTRDAKSAVTDVFDHDLGDLTLDLIEGRGEHLARLHPLGLDVVVFHMERDV